jgi:glycerate kinase
VHVLVAPDKFKGSLTAAEVAGHIAAGLRRVAGDGLAIACVPVADGGDGTLDAAIAAGERGARERADGGAAGAPYGRRGQRWSGWPRCAAPGLRPAGARPLGRRATGGRGHRRGAGRRVRADPWASAAAPARAAPCRRPSAQVYDAGRRAAPRGGDLRG